MEQVHTRQASAGERGREDVRGGSDDAQQQQEEKVWSVTPLCSSGGATESDWTQLTASPASLSFVLLLLFLSICIMDFVFVMFNTFSFLFCVL